jgi:glycosyltransferase involved in cell wall biosynthesis
MIEALALLPKNVLYEVCVIGDGPRRRQWQRLAERRGISANIRWCGYVPHEQALDLFRWADLFVFTSLRDTTGTVVLEAIAAGKPVICLDHQGAGDVVTQECGVKISVTNRMAVQRELCDAITRLQSDSRLCQDLARGARQRAAGYLWSVQARRIVEEYNRILASVGSDARCEIGGVSEYAGNRLQPASRSEDSAQVESISS